MNQAARLARLWRAKLHLCWYQREQYWAAETLREHLFVHHDIYRRVLEEELAKRGIEMKTHTEYLKPGEDAWMRQWTIENELRSNFDFWKQIPGIRIVMQDTGERRSIISHSGAFTKGQ